MAGLVQGLSGSAVQYRYWIEEAKSASELDVPSMFAYRTQAAGVEVIRPIPLFLYEEGCGIDRDIADRALRHVESWVMRRSLLRLGFSNAGRVVAGLVSELREASPEAVADRTRAYLAAQNRAATYWPTDAEVR